jgi:hypothetical protein
MNTNELETLLAQAVGNLRGNLSAKEVMSIEPIAEIIRNLSAKKEADINALDIMAEIVLVTYDRMRAEKAYYEAQAREQARAYWAEVLDGLTAKK